MTSFSKGASRLFAAAIALSPLLAVRAHAQQMIPAPDYEPFRVDFAFAGAEIPDQKAYGGSVIVEPKFNLLDQLSLGARVEALVGGGGSLGAPGSGSVSVSQNIIAATLLKGDYYFTRSRVRPFVGLGFGSYAVVGQSVGTGSSGATVNQGAGRYFGVAPQVGIELGGLRLSATYNDLFNSQVQVTQTVGGQSQTTNYSNNYFTVELGFRIGGRHVARIEPAPAPAPAPR